MQEGFVINKSKRHIKIMSLVTIIITLVTSQCAIDLAKGLKASNNIIAEMTINCCNATGIVCNPKKEIIEINWLNMGFTGVMVATAIPPTLIKLDLQNSKVIGNLPTTWPNTLTNLFLGNNSLDGVISKLPVALKTVDLSRNKFSGTLPAELPLSISELYVNGNSLSGYIPMLPNIAKIHLGYKNSTGNNFTGILHLTTATVLYINGNGFTDVVIDNLTPLKECDISGNPLLNSPHLSNFTKCVRNDLTAAVVPKTPIPSPSQIKETIPTPSETPAEPKTDPVPPLETPPTTVPKKENPIVPTTVVSPSTSANTSITETNPTTIQTKEPNQVQNSANAESDAKPLTSSAIMLIVAGIVFIIVFALTIYYFRKTSLKKQQEFSNFAFEFEPEPVVEPSNQFAQRPAFEPVTPHSMKTNSAFHSNYYYGNTPANVV